MDKLAQPLTPLTRALLHSVPRKVYLWLQGLGIDVSAPGQHELGDLAVSWSFSAEDKRGAVTLLERGQPTFTICWDLDLIFTGGVTPGQPLLTPVEKDLGSFIKIERAIYDVLQDLDRKIREERNKPR